MGDEAKDLKLRLSTEGAAQTERDLQGVARAGKDISGITEQIGNAAKKAGDGKFLGKLGEDAAAAARGTGQAAEAAQSAAHQFGELKRSGEDVTKIYRGIGEAAEGGTRGIIGSLTAMRGLVGLLRSIGSVALGPVGVVLGAVAAGVAYLGKVSRENKEAIEKVFKDTAANSEQLKAAYASLEAAGTKSLEQQLAALRELSAGFDELQTRIDAADMRIPNRPSCRWISARPSSTGMNSAPSLAPPPTRNGKRFLHHSANSAQHSTIRLPMPIWRI
jgi:hypothetical protein